MGNFNGILNSICCIAAVSATSDLSAGNDSPGHSGKPNIIYILADDLGYGDISILGQKKFGTPNIDRLAKEGMIFTRHYCGGPVSSASRCCLMTGQHLGHAAVRGNKSLPGTGVMPLDPDIPTIPEAIKVNTDYVTGMCGRWHLGGELSDQTPFHRGFDYHFGKLSSDYANGYGVMIDPLWTEDGLHRPYEEYSQMHIEPMYENGELYNLSETEMEESRPINMDKLVTDKAVRFIENHADRNFFLYVAYALPHSPMEFHASTPPESYMDESWPDTERAFASMIRAMDSYVGRITECIDSLGLKEKTLIIFSSDNGAHNEGGHSVNFFKSNGQFSGYKRDMLDGGCHAPMIVRWPGTVRAGSTCDLLSAQWDIMPTVCELAGAPVPEHTDGISFAPSLYGKKQVRKHGALYWEFSEHPSQRRFWPRQSVVFDHWKVIRYIEEDRYEVYDLNTDIAEGNDVSSLHPEIVKKGVSIMEKEHESNEYFPIFPDEGYKPAHKGSYIRPANWEIEAALHKPMSELRKPGTPILSVFSGIIEIRYKDKVRLGNPYVAVNGIKDAAAFDILAETDKSGNIYTITLENGSYTIKDDKDRIGLFFRNVPGIDEGVGMQRYGPYNVWTIPVRFPGIDSFPEKEVQMAYWQYNDGTYAVALPLNGNGFRTVLGRDGKNFGSIAGGCPAGYVADKCPAMTIGFGENIYSLLKEVYTEALTRMGHSENLTDKKELPVIFDYLGWCSWNAIEGGKRHNAANLVKNLESFRKGNIRLGYAIIDDGWHTVDKRTLIDIVPNPERYPSGLKAVADYLKNGLGIKSVGTWHALDAYWNGIAPYGPVWDKYKDEMFSWTQTYTPKSKDSTVCRFFRPDSKALPRFWEEWFSYLEDNGVDMVKVDNQGCTVRMAPGNYPADYLSEKMHDAVNEAAFKYMDGRLVNCMALNTDAFYHFGSTAVARCSEDYFPYSPKETYNLTRGNAAAHITQCLYNNLYLSQMVYTDMDMFQTYNPNGEMHALARVLNNGPVYVTDSTGKQRFDILDRMISEDGRLVRASSPLYPCEESLFQIQDRELFKAFSYAGQTGLIGAFNLADCDRVSGHIKASDVDGMKGNDFIIYDYFAGKTLHVSRDEMIPVELGRMGYALYYVSPYDGFTALGIIDEYIAPATVREVKETGNQITVSLTEGGRLLCISDRKPAKVTIGGLPQKFTYDENGCTAVTVGSSSGCEIVFHF